MLRYLSSNQSVYKAWPLLANLCQGITLSLAVAAASFIAVLTSLSAKPDGERARIAAVTLPATDFSRPERHERRPGGAATVFKVPNRDAFSHPSANMSFEQQLDFKVGNGIFKKVWVSAPSSTSSSDGLGPLFNARSCQRCHLKDSRGRPPAEGERAESMFLRLSIPPQTEADRAALREHRQAVIPEPLMAASSRTFRSRACSQRAR